MTNRTINAAIRFLAATAGALLLAATAGQAKPAALVDARVQWTGSMPAKTHTGLLPVQNLELDLGDNGTINALHAVLDMTRIDVTDLSGKNRQKLVDHLSSEDFFFAERYPTAEFLLGDHRDGKLHGRITIRGITRDIALPVKLEQAPDGTSTLSGEFTFDRQNFNVNYQNGGVFGVAKDKIIRDDIEVAIMLKVKL